MSTLASRPSRDLHRHDEKAHCSAPRIDADALDAQVLAALRDFYTNRLDEAQEAITAARAEHHRTRAGHESELATVNEQLTTKETVVDRYLTEYEDNKIDRDPVAQRVEKVSEQIRQLRHRRNELIFPLDLDGQAPDTAHLTQIRDRIIEIIDAGTPPERKAMCEAMLSELRIDSKTATPVIRIPLSMEDTPGILRAEARTTHQRAVRACPPSVDFLVLEQGIDASTPIGWLFFRFMAALAEFDREAIVEGTLDGLASARSRGRVGGRRAAGGGRS